MSDESELTGGAETQADALHPAAADYIEAWAESLAQVLGQMAGRTMGFQIAPPTTPPEPTSGTKETGAFPAMHIVVTAAGGLRGEMSLRLSPESIGGLAAFFLGEPAAAEASAAGEDASAEAEQKAAEKNAADEKERQEAVLELARQVAGLVATALHARWGEVQLHAEEAKAGPSWAAGASGSLVPSAGETSSLAIEWSLSAALNAALLAPPSAAVSSQTSAGRDSSAPSLVETPEDNDPGVLPGEGKFDLVLDVELNVALRFGRRNMLLREILELLPGSVIELDRQIQEPADLLLDGKLVARGEIVVVDGNYGLRVQQVVAALPPV